MNKSKSRLCMELFIYYDEFNRTPECSVEDKEDKVIKKT